MNITWNFPVVNIQKASAMLDYMKNAITINFTIRKLTAAAGASIACTAYVAMPCLLLRFWRKMIRLTSEQVTNKYRLKFHR